MDGNLQARQGVPVESDEMWHLAVCCLLSVFGEVSWWRSRRPRCNPDRQATVRTDTSKPRRACERGSLSLHSVRLAACRAVCIDVCDHRIAIDPNQAAHDAVLISARWLQVPFDISDTAVRLSPEQNASSSQRTIPGCPISRE